MNNNIIDKIKNIVNETQIFIDEPLSKHTTFRIGGPADVFVEVKSIDEISLVVKACLELDIPYFVLGNGSNILVSDSGFRGVIIHIYSEFSNIECDGEVITALSGSLLSKVAYVAKENSLTGFEFAAGIPGTLGGGVMMNAGAYGGELKDIVKSAKVLDKQGNILDLSNEDMKFGYRTSVVEAEEYIVLAATIKLESGNKTDIEAKMEELKQARVSKQPLEYPSAGSTFKRPEGYFAGKLIMDSGLRGASVGDAMVSEKHCGFVINKGHASAKDVIELIDNVRKSVKEKYGVELETEVKMLGEF